MDIARAWGKAALTLALLAALGVSVWKYNVPLADLGEYAGRFGRGRVALLLALLFGVISIAPIPGRDVVKLVAADVLGFFSIFVIWAGEMVAAAVGFGLARWGGHDLVSWFGGARVADLNDKLHGATWRSIFVLRVLPVTPYRFFNFAAGLVELRFAEYFWGSAGGILLRTAFFQVLFVFFDAGLKARGTTMWEIYVYSMAAVPLMALVWWLTRRRKKSADKESAA